MATACLSSDNLVCPICLGQFDRPRSLPCLHTFCTSCLCAHIETISESMPFSTFPCPVCRAVTRPVRQFTSRHTWAEQFPVNYWISSILEEQSGIKPYLICEQHSDMKVSLFCKDHQSTCCPTCVALQHRQCVDVVEIEAELKYVDLHKEKRDIEKMIGELQSRISDVQNVTDNINEKLETKKTNVTSKIRTNVDVVISKIQEDQSRLINDLDEHFAYISERIKTNRTLCRSGASICENACQTLLKVDVDDHDQATLTFIKLQSEKIRLTNLLNRKTKQVTSDRDLIDDINFNMSEHFRSMLENVHIGNIEDSKYTGDIMKTIDIVNRKDLNKQRNKANVYDAISDDSDDIYTCSSGRRTRPLLVTENNCLNFVRIFNVSTIHSGLSWITSAVFIQNDILLVSDHKSKSLKIVKDGRCVFEFRGTLTPWSIALIHDSKVAVSHPDQNCINIYNIKPDISSLKMKVLRKLNLTQPFDLCGTIDVEDACFGLCFTGRHLVVACEDAIKVFDLDGRCTQVLRGHFRRVVGIAYSSVTTSVYTCDEIEHCDSAFKMKFIRVENTPSFAYTHSQLTSPQNVAVGQKGEVYVSGFVSQNIHIVSQNGESLLIVKVDQQPWAVCVDVLRMMLFISFYPDNRSGGSSSLYELEMSSLQNNTPLKTNVLEC